MTKDEIDAAFKADVLDKVSKARADGLPNEEIARILHLLAGTLERFDKRIAELK